MCFICYLLVYSLAIIVLYVIAGACVFGFMDWHLFIIVYCLIVGCLGCWFRFIYVVGVWLVTRLCFGYFVSLLVVFGSTLDCLVVVSCLRYCTCC